MPRTAVPHKTSSAPELDLSGQTWLRTSALRLSHASAYEVCRRGLPSAASGGRCLQQCVLPVGPMYLQRGPVLSDAMLCRGRLWSCRRAESCRGAGTASRPGMSASPWYADEPPLHDSLSSSQAIIDTFAACGPHYGSRFKACWDACFRCLTLPSVLSTWMLQQSLPCCVRWFLAPLSYILWAQAMAASHISLDAARQERPSLFAVVDMLPVVIPILSEQG